MRAVAAAAMLLRWVRGQAAILVLVFSLVAATSFVFAAAPRLLNRVADDAIRLAVASESAVARHVRLNATGRIEAGTAGGTAALRAYGEERQRDLPASLERLVADRYLGVSSVRLAVDDSIVAVSLRYQDGATDLARVVSGRWPVDRGMPLQLVDVVDPGDPAAVFEAALSASSAEVAGVSVGDRLPVALDRSDPAVRSLPLNLAPTEIEIVGLFEAVDPGADPWAGSGLLEPSLRQGAAGVEAINTTALIAGDAYPNLAAAELPYRYDWHFQVDPARLDAGQVETLRADLQRLGLVTATDDERTLPDLDAEVRLSDVSFGSGMSSILEAFAIQRSRTESVLAIAALGPIGLAAAAMAMLAGLLVRRRRSSILLARGRGASGRLLVGAQLGEAALLTGAAALTGYLLAVSVVPARDAPLSVVLAVAVAIVGSLLIVLAAWPTAHRPLMQLEREDAPVLRVPPRRLVIEATVVGIAVLAVVLLRQRGLSVEGNGEVAQSDPLLAAVPLLSGIAAGIVALRLYPWPVRALGWLAARRRDFVPVLGLRTVARHSAIANLPLLVLMLAAAFGAFVSVVQSSLDRGQAAASYLEVGADYRLESGGRGGLPAALRPGEVPGIDAVAAGVVEPRGLFIGADGQRLGVVVNMVEAGAYAVLTAGTSAQPDWPGPFLAQPIGDGIGTAAKPIPALVSGEFPPGRTNVGNRETFTVELDGQPLVFRLVARRGGIPGLEAAGDFLIVPLDWMTAALPDRRLTPTVMWLRGSADAAEPLGAAVSAASRDLRVVSRQAAYSRLRDAPLGTAVADGFAVALGVAVLYLAVTLIGAVIMSAAGRTRDLAYLRTLGVSARQALALTAVEHAMPVVLALVPGVLLGVVVALLVEPGLGLAAFTGARSVPLFVDWPTLGLIAMALAAVVVAAISIGTWMARRPRLASALRIEDR